MRGPGPTASMAAPKAVASAVPARTGAAPDAPDASTKTVSLVLVSPSTRQLVPRPRSGGPQQAPQRLGRHGRIGQDDRQHRGHPRVDHPDALRDAADRDGHWPPVRVRQRRRSWWRAWSPSRWSEARSRSASSPASLDSSDRDERGEPSGDALERQSRADDPGGEVERQFLGGADRRRDQMRRSRRWSASPAAPVAALAEPLVETTAVGPAESAARVAGGGRERCARDRRTGAAANAFGCEDRGRGGRSVGGDRDDREVRATRRLDPGHDPTGAEAGRHGRRAVRPAGAPSATPGPGERCIVVMARAEAVRVRPSRAGRGRG